MHWTAVLLAASVTACASATVQPEKTPVELTGTVVGRTLTRSATGAWHELAALETADGRRVMVDFGPPGGEATIAEGERVKVTGHTAQRAGDRVVVANVVVRVAPAASRGR